MCHGRGAVVFCPGGRLVFQRSWGGSESDEPAERNLASVSCHRWLLSESARISVWNLSRGRSKANNYAASLSRLQRYEEAKALFRKTMPVARRVLGESNELTLKMRWCYALALYRDSGATLDDLHEAVSTLEETERLWTRVFGAAHPETPRVQGALEFAREELARAGASESKPPP